MSQPQSPPTRPQLVPDPVYPLNIPEEHKEIVMAQRRLTTVAFHQLQAEVNYCTPRGHTPLEDGEQFLRETDDNLSLWRDDLNKQGVNAAITLHNGVIEARFFGPDQTLNECFFAACGKLELATRYPFGVADKAVAQSILFKLRDDEAKRFEAEYSAFRPKPFIIEEARRGVMFNYAPPVRKGSTAHKVTTLLPGSLLWHEDGVHYDLLVWRQESGQGDAVRWQTGPAQVEFFALARAAAYASILNIVSRSLWESPPNRWTFCEWLARVARDGQAINANVVFAQTTRAIIATTKHAQDLIELICQYRGKPGDREECLGKFVFAQQRLEKDPTRIDVAGWAILRERFGEEIEKAFRGILNVGADSSLLEEFAERYLFCDGEFIDRKAFREGREKFIFAKDKLTLEHAPDLIQTKKKPVEAFPLFIKSKLRQDVTGLELHPDCKEGAILRVTRQGAVVPDDDFAPERSRLVFNEWAGLYIPPAKTIDEALKAECLDKLDHMLSLVTNRHEERAAWIKAHIGWTLKHPGQKQQVALVCTGDQGTGKTFLCKDFAEAVFGKYAGIAAIKSLEGQFYVASYVRKLWVNHDEVVSKPETIEIVKDLVRSTKISGEFKGRDVATYTTYARLAFTSNEANPGLSRGLDRGIFQVTSITAEGENLLPGEFQDRMNREVKPFYKSFAEFLKRDDVRQTYVKLLIGWAPDSLAQVEDLTHSAMRDLDVARKHLTPEQLVAKTILEEGTIWGGYDIAMPFGPGPFRMRVNKLAGQIGVRNANAEAVLDLFIEAGLLQRPQDGKPYLFKFKMGTLQQEFSKFLGVKLYSSWELEPNDYMPNDYRHGDAMEPWKGRGK